MKEQIVVMQVSNSCCCCCCCCCCFKCWKNWFYRSQGKKQALNKFSDKWSLGIICISSQPLLPNFGEWLKFCQIKIGIQKWTNLPKTVTSLPSPILTIKTWFNYGSLTNNKLLLFSARNSQQQLLGNNINMYKKN